MTPTHRHEAIARAAYRYSSLYPEERAESDLERYDAQRQWLVDQGFDDGVLERLDRLWIAVWSARSRCASTMVTGSAKFNVERNRKNNAILDRRIAELGAFMDVNDRIVKRREAAAALGDGDPVLAALKQNKQRIEADIAKIKATPVNQRVLDLPSFTRALKRIEKRIAALEKPKESNEPQ